MTTGCPFSITDTQELVVPKSMPIVLPILIYLLIWYDVNNDFRLDESHQAIGTSMLFGFSGSTLGNVICSMPLLNSA